MTEEINQLEPKARELEKLRAEQDELLGQIFNGEYGSEAENRLEQLLYDATEMRNRVAQASFKWQQAKMTITYAYKQLEYAVQKWEHIKTMEPTSVVFAILSEVLSMILMQEGFTFQCTGGSISSCH